MLLVLTAIHPPYTLSHTRTDNSLHMADNFFNLVSLHLLQSFRPSQGYHHRHHHQLSRLIQQHLRNLVFVEVIQRVGGGLQENLRRVDLEFQEQVQ